MKTAVLALLLAGALAAGTAAAAPAPRCSAATLSRQLPKQQLPPRVEAMRQRIVDAAVACDYGKLEALGRPNGFTFSFGATRSAAAYWRMLETTGRDRPLAKLVQVLRLRVTRNEAGAYAWPSAYSEKPTARDWADVVRAGILTRRQADAMRSQGTGYLGYRVGITRAGDWQFFVAGD
jgi:hypothetical protein